MRLTPRWMASMLVLALIVVAAAMVRARTPAPRLVTVRLTGTPYVMMAVDPRHGRAIILLNSPAGSSRVATVDTVAARLVRTVATSSANGIAVAIDRRTAHAFVIDNGGGGAIDTLDVRTGALVQTLTYGDAAPQAVFVDEGAGYLFVATDQPSFHGLRVYSTARLRPVRDGSGAVARGGFLPTVAVDSRAHRAFVAFPVIPSADGSVSPHDSIVQTVDTTTGVLLRTVRFKGSEAKVAVDPAAGRAIVIDGLGSTLRVLDSHTGRVVSTVRVAIGFTDLAVDERTHRAFATSFDGRVSMIETRTGRVLTGIRLSRGFNRVAVDAARQWVLVSSADGSPTGRLNVLDARTGRSLRIIDLPLTPDLLAVDEQSGRIIVAGTLPAVSDPWGWLPAWLRTRLPLPRSPSKAQSNTGGVTLIDETNL